MPSIQSASVIPSGSYCTRVSEPSGFREVSKLATCPGFTQLNVVPKWKVAQFGDTLVELLAIAVIGPFVAVCNVTFCVDSSTAETIPVTSSIKSNAEGGKLLADDGRIVAVKTSAAPRLTAVIAW